MEISEVDSKLSRAPKHGIGPLMQPLKNVWNEMQSTFHEIDSNDCKQPLVGNFSKYRIFSALIITTVTSFVLLASAVHNWTVSGPGGFYHVIISNRASYQLLVQVLANFLGLIHVTIIAALINYATRLRLSSKATSLDAIRFWHGLCTRNTEWDLPLRFLLPLGLFILVTVVPSALWAGAITVVSVSVTKSTVVSTPSYLNATLVHEYTDRSGVSVPSLRSTKGAFTYNVGQSLIGSLLSSASSATTVDGSLRQHAKLDNTRFTYSGRSYGIGASVGLLDDVILGNPLATHYTFQETGYDAHVACIYNSSSNFTIIQFLKNNFAIEGYAPNGIRPEYADYFGYSEGPIVAIGVSSVQTPGRMMGITAGAAYDFLNTTQCLIDFVPTIFNVSVGIIGRNITVTPVSTNGVSDISPSGNLSYTTMRQFLLVSTDQTGLYTSLVGISFNNSISDYNLSLANAGREPVSRANSTLEGLQNSVTAMADDILGAYAAAQVMIGKSTSDTAGTVEVLALQFGQNVYIYSVTVMNAVILLAVVVEWWRTRGWRGLEEFDYMNIGAVILDSSRGGTGVAAARVNDKLQDMKRYQRQDGKIKVLYEEGKISTEKRFSVEMDHIDPGGPGFF